MGEAVDQTRAPPAEFQCSESVAAAIARLGRTEDIRFSPDNRMLVIAGFTRKKLLCIKVDTQADAGAPRVSVRSFMEITSDGIEDVHGLDFIDHRTLAVANRSADVAIVRLPDAWRPDQSANARVLRRIKGPRWHKISSPGSLVVTRLPFGQVRLMVCNNYARRVTEHIVAPQLGYRSWRNRPILRQGLDIPDGIAVSPDGRWIAVSSHGTHDVKIFDGSAPLGKHVQPVSVLKNAGYPHGLRFCRNGKYLLVADAGAPNVNVFRSEGGWAGEYLPFRTVRLLDSPTFERGHTSPLEGGPKGLDIDKSEELLAITCEEQPLAFFPMQAILGDRQVLTDAT